MVKNNIVETDKLIDNLYNTQMKPMLDHLHKEFIHESLSRKIFDENFLQEYFNLIVNYKKLSLKKDRQDNDSKDFKNLEEIIEVKALVLRKCISASFETIGGLWKDKYSKLGIKLKGKTYDILTEPATRKILLKEFPDKEKVLDEFKGFWTYFGGFNMNRENYYSVEAKATSIANRTINENLSRYIDNIISFKQVLDKIPALKEYEQLIAINSYNLYLNQDGIDSYNQIIGGYVDENQKKIQGINEKINLFYQENKIKLPKLKMLYKQIGSDKKGLEIFTVNEGEEWSILKDFFNLQRKEIVHNGNKVRLYESLRKMYRDFFSENKSLPDTIVFDLDKIYLNKISLNTISNNWFISWRTLADLLKIKLDKKTGEQKIPAQISLAQIRDALVLINKDNLESLFKSTNRFGNDRKSEFGENAWISFLSIWSHEIEENFSRLDQLEREFEENSKKEFKKNDKHQTAFIKDVCDAVLAIGRMAKYHLPKDTNLPQDEDFYWITDLVSHEYEIVKYYNAFRNHLSKKPYSKDKIKLNFECGSLLGGWSDGQERNKLGVILNNDGKYYLGILVNRALFRTDLNNNEIYKTSHTTWQRLILTNLKFKTLAGKGFKSENGQSYGEMDPLKSVELLQDFISRKYLKKYPQLTLITQTKFPSKKLFDEKIGEVLKECFTMNFVSFSEEKLFESEKNGEIYLFEIYNKDFSKRTAKNLSSNENIHTSYWKTLFSLENCKLPVFALNADAEVFYRENQKDKLFKKLDNKGKEVIDGKRYSENKIFFHVPITINYGKPKKMNFKDLMNQTIAEKEFNIIGIDRGEKHLIYYSIINPKGEILKQGSLNKINVGASEVDFHQKLTVRAVEMMNARQNWQQIGNIKNFKEGYLSQVVHEIYQLMIEHDAVVVLEDLNSDFKLKRTAKVEKSVYKKFELALAKKLNYLVLKNRSHGELGSASKGYQLTPQVGPGDVGKFEKAKQWGAMFYVRANYTSTTDPVTGWRKHLYIMNSSNIESIKTFFEPKNPLVGIKIFYSEKFGAWGFKYKHRDTGKEWELVATKDKNRFSYDPEKRENKSIDLHKEFESLFAEVKDKSGNIFDQISIITNFKWKSLVYFWNLLNQIRNTDRKMEGNENDFLQSPVYSDKINGFYDSRKYKEYKFELPENGDANGAFNTARKGLILLNRIKDNPVKYDQFIRDIDWDKKVTGV